MIALPLVSIILTTFNRAYIVDKAIESVLKQTYKNFELLVIDDGSYDKTRKVISAFGSKLSYYYKANGGQASALNFGIEKAQGDFIAFIDSDDQYKNNHIELLMEPVLYENYKLVIGSFDLKYEGPEPMVLDYFNNNHTILLSETEAFLGGMLIQKDILHKAGGFQGTLVDIDLLSRLKKLNYTYKKISEKSYDYYYGLCEDSVIIQTTNNALKELKTANSKS
jgi:glycosyltransferase involved in cell wall biosynthesis